MGTVKLNEKVISQEEFNKKKEEIENMKDAKLVEVGKDEFKIKLQD